jgi:hypothetical protein
MDPLRDFTNKTTDKLNGAVIKDYKDWTFEADSVTDKALKQAGCKGSIGFGDNFKIGGNHYFLYECNASPNPGTTNWRVVLYGSKTNEAKILNLGGFTEISKPRISLSPRKGNKYKATMTFYLPKEGAKKRIEATAGEAVISSSFTFP